MSGKIGPENKYARKEATQFLNGYAPEGKFCVSPTTNIAAIINDVRAVLMADPKTRWVVNKLNHVFQANMQESGKPDLFALLPNITPLAVEVKGIVGKLTRDCLRANQIEWAQKMTWYDVYWIFLWAYDGDALPKEFRTKEAQERRFAYFIPLDYWIRAWDNVERVAQTKTIHFRNERGGRKALSLHAITIDGLFGLYGLQREGSLWRFPSTHPLFETVDNSNRKE